MVVSLYKMLVLFVAGLMLLIGSVVSQQLSWQLLTYVFFATSLLTTSIGIAWFYLYVVRPFKTLNQFTQANNINTPHSDKNVANSLPHFFDELQRFIVKSNETRSTLQNSFDHDHDLVVKIEQELNSIRIYSEHLVAIDEEHTFSPDDTRQAFLQGESAADYATGTFEKIYYSISNLGQSFSQVHSNSAELRENATRSVVLVQQTSLLSTQLAEQANEISDVTRSIADIANMTQLLALNASIEAARAGESGRGFAVVADEVKKLAEQTDIATKRISAISQNILQSSRVSSTSMTEIDQTIRAVSESVATVLAEIEKQWNEVQVLLGQMGQTAGTVSGLKGILQASSAELESHFQMLEGIYQFATASLQSMNRLASILSIPPIVESASHKDETDTISENDDL